MSSTPTKEKIEGRTDKGGKRIRRSLSKKQLRFLLPLALLLCLLLAWGLHAVRSTPQVPIENPKVAALAKLKLPRWVQHNFIPEGSDSRRGEILEEFTGIVIHYVGNPGTTAKQNRTYYANPGTEVNSHFLVGLEGEILQCLPLMEKSSASSQRNRDTLSIEVCHPDESGAFTAESYASLLRLTAWLCVETQLPPEQVIRHYDVTGKLCPLYYVEQPEAWEGFLSDLRSAVQESE